MEEKKTKLLPERGGQASPTETWWPGARLLYLETGCKAEGGAEPGLTLPLAGLRSLLGINYVPGRIT